MVLRQLATEECKDGFTCPGVWVDDDDPDHVIVVGVVRDSPSPVPVGPGEVAVRLRRQTVRDARL
ncbi:hypothetical protein [Frankia sp. Cr1]|uniref:hypothetical protein n=1 Tax=Frankia sp. Cr1 TaxID=3073931 RepID=UPI002AD25D8E|nr:hypothetical protein [Frankia sp. Cr1]